MPAHTKQADSALCRRVGIPFWWRRGVKQKKAQWFTKRADMWFTGTFHNAFSYYIQECNGCGIWPRYFAWINLFCSEWHPSNIAGEGKYPLTSPWVLCSCFWLTKNGDSPHWIQCRNHPIWINWMPRCRLGFGRGTDRHDRPARWAIRSDVWSGLGSCTPWRPGNTYVNSHDESILWKFIHNTKISGQ